MMSRKRALLPTILTIKNKLVNVKRRKMKWREWTEMKVNKKKFQVVIIIKLTK
jgi:hypothetical protein